MRIYLTIMASVAVSATAPALASNVPASARVVSESTLAAVGKSKEAAAEKKICRNLDATGTRMTERVCLTAHEWKKVEQQAR